MAKKNAVESLRESIRLLEIKQEEEGRALKEQFKLTYESLKLVNLLKSSLKDLTESNEVKNSLFETVVSILSGYISKKIMVGEKSNPLMKILGVIMQFGITSVVAKNADAIREFFFNFIDKLFHHSEGRVTETEV